jgi:serralysin
MTNRTVNTIYASSLKIYKNQDEHIVGISGFELVVFDISRSNVQIERNYIGGYLTSSGEPKSYSITAVSKAKTFAIERIKFTDVSVAFDFFGYENAGLNNRPPALWVAKTLGAVFGKSALANKEYAGIGLYCVDELDYSYLDLMQLAINARLGAKPSHDQVVDLLYTNLVGTAPDAATRQSFTKLLDNGTLTVGGLGVLAADTELNEININLVGLVDTGLEYVPYSG